MCSLGPRLPFAGRLDGNFGGSPPTPEHPDMIALREALGALPLGEPGMCRVFNDNGEWHVHRHGGIEDATFPTKDDALAFARLSLVRCVAYCLLLQQEDGRLARESFNWQPRRVK
jgi:hypothetical protein